MREPAEAAAARRGGIGPSPRAAGLFVLGWGNPDRQDDGLGPRVVEELQCIAPHAAVFRTSMQPEPGHCADMAGSRAALFIDASRDGSAPFSLERIWPEEAADGRAIAVPASFSFTTHFFRLPEILAVGAAALGAPRVAWCIGVRGYVFGAGEGLSAGAERNARAVAAFLRSLFEGIGEVAMAESGAGARTILIVDDDPDVRGTLRMILESAGFMVGEAADGESGLKAAERVKPDAILLDLMMETVDAGSRVSAHLRESGFTCPIYLISAAGDSVRYNIGIAELGLAGIFQKPIEPQVLLRTLKTMLNVE